MKTRTFKRILGTVTAAALSLSVVGFGNQIFKYDNNSTYDITASATDPIIDLGDFDTATNKFSAATSTKDTVEYNSLVVGFSKGSGDVELPTVSGYTYDSTLSTEGYSYVVKFDAAKSPKAVAESYIKNIAFYSGSAESEIYITLNKTAVANKTIYYAPNGHFYQFINRQKYEATHANVDLRSWKKAYEEAQKMSFAGRKGYLATITNAEEETYIQKASNKEHGWLGGTRMTPPTGGTDPMYYDFSSVTTALTGNGAYWYWACGPEKGKSFYQAEKYDASTDAAAKDNADYHYNNWDRGPEPNGSGDALTSECCLVTWNENLKWNDVSEMWSGISQNDYDHLGGFFVEYGDETTGDSGAGDASSTDITVIKELTQPAQETIVLGDLNTNKFDKARGIGDGTFNSMVIGFAQKSVSGTETISLPANVNGYTKNNSLSTDGYSYVVDFDTPKTPTEIALQYIRKIEFTTSTDTQIFITLNKQKVEYKTIYHAPNGHFYQFVEFKQKSDFKTWVESYNLAKGMTFAGRQGYLATITDAKEDKYVRAASDKSGWYGATRISNHTDDGTLYYNYDEKDFEDPTVDGETNKKWYWACGPERGQTFYMGAKYTDQNVRDGRNIDYDNWASDQPDAFGKECCLTTFGSFTDKWNDLNNDAEDYWDYQGGTYRVYGFFVEFGDETTGDSGQSTCANEDVYVKKFIGSGSGAGTTEHTVTFNITDTSKTPNTTYSITQKVLSNDTITPLSETGYRFEYYDNTNPDTRWKINTAITANIDVNVKKVPSSYDIEYYAVENGVIDKVSVGTYTFGSKATLQSATKPGYIIDSWYSDEALTKPVTSISDTDWGKQKFYGKWTVKPSSAPAYETIEEYPFIFHDYGDGEIILAECDPSVEIANIPEEVNGKPVTTIGENAFNSCSMLTKVNIPDTVTKIEKSAFWGCTGLETIIIPRTVIEIDKEVFKRCTNFKEIWGYRGTTAEEYAKTNNIKFVPLDGEQSTTSVSESASEITTTTTVTTITAAETMMPLPDKPTNIKVDENGLVTWDKANGAVAYKICKQYNNDDYYGKRTEETQYQMEFLPEVQYKLFVRAYNEKGEYIDSEPVFFETKGLGISEAPETDGEGNVTWKPVEKAVKYRVVKEWNNMIRYGEETSELSYTLKKIPSVDYMLYIRAYDEKGNFTDGAKISVQGKSRLGRVGVPEVDDATGIVTWKPAENAVAYRIVKKHSGKTFFGFRTSDLEYQMHFNPNAQYDIYIRAYDEDGNYTNGEILHKPAKVLGKVTDPTANEEGNVTWSAVPNAVSYKLAKVVGGKTYYTGILYATNFTFRNVPKSDYKIFVVAFDKEGNKTWGKKVDITV